VLIAPDAAPAGGVPIDVASSNPALVQVLTPVVTVPEGQFSATATFRAAVGAAGAAVLTASNPGFAPDNTDVVVTAGLRLFQTFSNFSAVETETLFVELRSGGLPYPAPAGGVSLDLTSGDPACVAVSTPLPVAEDGALGSAVLSYGGSATLPCTTTVTLSNVVFGSVLLPVTVDDTAPDLGPITVFDGHNGDYRLGSGLQVPYRVQLASGAHGGVTVQVASSDPTVARLSATATGAGGPMLEVFIADGMASSVNFYAQGVQAATGDVTLTATQALFTDGT